MNPPSLIQTRASLMLGMRSKMQSAFGQLVEEGSVLAFETTATGFVVNFPGKPEVTLSIPEAITFLRSAGFEVTP